jgi:mRNA interferase RelE/StbE
MVFRIVFSPRASRDFDALPVVVQNRLKPRIDALASSPRPPGVAKLAGPELLWRVRVSDYRIVYEIRDQELIVLVVRLGHRREVYRGR